jgi:predicted DNA-binding protein
MVKRARVPSTSFRLDKETLELLDSMSRRLKVTKTEALKAALKYTSIKTNEHIS